MVKNGLYPTKVLDWICAMLSHNFSSLSRLLMLCKSSREKLSTDTEISFELSGKFSLKALSFYGFETWKTSNFFCKMSWRFRNCAKNCCEFLFFSFQQDSNASSCAINSIMKNNFITSRNDNTMLQFSFTKLFFIPSIYFYHSLDIHYKESFIYRWKISTFWFLSSSTKTYQRSNLV